MLVAVALWSSWWLSCLLGWSYFFPWLVVVRCRLHLLRLVLSWLSSWSVGLLVGGYSGGRTVGGSAGRKRVLFRELEKRVALPAELKGYMTLREAKLNEASWDAIEIWTEGSCECDEIIEKLRRLERPAPPGKGS